MRLLEAARRASKEAAFTGALTARFEFEEDEDRMIRRAARRILIGVRRPLKYSALKRKIEFVDNDYLLAEIDEDFPSKRNYQDEEDAYGGFKDLEPGAPIADEAYMNLRPLLERWARFLCKISVRQLRILDPAPPVEIPAHLLEHHVRGRHELDGFKARRVISCGTTNSPLPLSGAPSSAASKSSNETGRNQGGDSGRSYIQHRPLLRSSCDIIVTSMPPGGESARSVVSACMNSGNAWAIHVPLHMLQSPWLARVLRTAGSSAAPRALSQRNRGGAAAAADSGTTRPLLYTITSSSHTAMAIKSSRSYGGTDLWERIEPRVWMCWFPHRATKRFSREMLLKIQLEQHRGQGQEHADDAGDGTLPKQQGELGMQQRRASGGEIVIARSYSDLPKVIQHVGRAIGLAKANEAREAMKALDAAFLAWNSSSSSSSITNNAFVASSLSAAHTAVAASFVRSGKIKDAARLASVALSRNLPPIPELFLTITWAFASRGDVASTKKGIQDLRDHQLGTADGRGGGDHVHAAAAILTAHSIARERRRRNSTSPPVEDDGDAIPLRLPDGALQIPEMKAMFGEELDSTTSAPEWQQRVFTLCLDNCAAARALAAAEQWFERIRTSTNPPLRVERSSYAALVNSWAKSLRLMQQRSQPQQPNDRHSSAGASSPSLHSYGRIHRQRVLGAARRVEFWLKRMIEDGLRPEPSLFHTTISALGMAGSVASAQRWFDELQERSEHLRATPVSYGVIIGAYAANGNTERAASLLAEMRARSIVPDASCFLPLILHAHSPHEAGAWMRALTSLAEKERRRARNQSSAHPLGYNHANPALSIPREAYEAVVRIQARHHQWVEAESTLHKMTARAGIKPNVPLLLPISEAHYKEGRYRRLEDLFIRALRIVNSDNNRGGARSRSRQHTANVKATGKVFSLLLQTYAKLQLAPRAEATFRSIFKSSNLSQPDQQRTRHSNDSSRSLSSLSEELLGDAHVWLPHLKKLVGNHRYNVLLEETSTSFLLDGRRRERHNVPVRRTRSGNVIDSRNKQTRDEQ